MMTTVGNLTTLTTNTNTQLYNASTQLTTTYILSTLTTLVSPTDSTASAVLAKTTNTTLTMASTVRPTNLTTTLVPTPPNAIVHVSETAATAIAVYMGFLTFFGIFNNSIVLFLYYRYKNLHNPVNMFLINISLGDFIVSCLGSPFMFASAVAGHWLFGDGGCTWYAFIVTLAGKSSNTVDLFLACHNNRHNIESYVMH